MHSYTKIDASSSRPTLRLLSLLRTGRIPALGIGLLLLHTAVVAWESDKASQKITVENLDTPFLEQLLFDLTNQERARLGFSALLHNDSLRQTARRHATEMAYLPYFSHTSPLKVNRTLKDRLQNGGMTLRNIWFGENIAVDFILKISGVRYLLDQRNGKIVALNADTRCPIVNQEYGEFSESMMRSWMKSPGHRENILNSKYKEMGIGACLGRYKGFEAVYVTQVFKGSIPKEKNR